MHNGKSPQAFRTISEAATEVGEKDHVLRFWEKEIKELNPIKNHGSRRYYRPEDISLLHAIRYFLRKQGYKIEGVQKLLRTYGVEKFIALYQNRLAGSRSVSVSDNVDKRAVDISSEALLDTKLAHLRVLHHDMMNFRDRLSSFLR